MTGPNPLSVPIKAYLYPLWKLDRSRARPLVQEISKSLVSEMIRIMQYLEDYKEEAQDLMESTPYQHFPFFTDKINRSLHLLQRYQQQFKIKAATLIPQIRGAGKEQEDFANILEQHFLSPFKKINVDKWLRLRKSESAVLASFIQLLTPIKYCANVGEYMTWTMNNNYAVALNLYFQEGTEHFLDFLDQFLDGDNVTDPVEVEQPWFYRHTIRRNILINIHDILQFRKANKEGPVQFLYAILPSPNQTQWPFSEIKGVYSQGRFYSEETFIPPLFPGSIEETSSTPATVLNWKPPLYGSNFINYYQIVITERGQRLGQDPIEYRYRTASNETSFQITKPDSSVPYDVYVYGVCTIGRTASSDILHHSGVKVRLVGGAEICSPHTGRIEVYILFKMEEIIIGL